MWGFWRLLKHFWVLFFGFKIQVALPSRKNNKFIEGSYNYWLILENDLFIIFIIFYFCRILFFYFFIFLFFFIFKLYVNC